jgi:hypothetical protein
MISRFFLHQSPYVISLFVAGSLLSGELTNLPMDFPKKIQFVVVFPLKPPFVVEYLIKMSIAT